jgi:hypothetical protein
MDMANEIIGYAVAALPFEYSTPQEFAGAVENVSIAAGRYPVRVTRHLGRVDYHIVLDGVSMYRGWFGSNTHVSRTPERVTRHAHVYGYELAFAVLEGKPVYGMTIELAPGYEARRIDFERDGQARHTAGIYLNGSEVK